VNLRNINLENFRRCKSWQRRRRKNKCL